MVTRRLRCLFRRHRWHNGWDEFAHVTVWTCTRCGKERPDSASKNDSGGYRPPKFSPPVSGGAF